MQRESTLGRALWIALLVVLGGYVVADFVRPPFLAGSGSAAVRPAELTLWSAAGEASGETGAVVQGAAAALELNGHTSVVKTLEGGSSQAVAEFLADPPHGDGAPLLVVSSSTLANLARDRRDRLIPGAAEEAAKARELLRRSIPLGLIESDPLAIVVARDSGVESSAELLSELRESPWMRRFAIADDIWSRVQLAAMVNRAGVDGHIPFSVFQSGAETGEAIVNGAANTAVATRGALREDVQAGRLRELPWPFAGEAPRSWVVLVAAPGTAPARVAGLRRWIADLSRDPSWRRELRHSGRIPGDPGSVDPEQLLRGGTARADQLELLAQRVEQR
ncbi:MAG TPA: hypothetical protein VF081_12355 [Solirubrobacterales bacterium]